MPGALACLAIRFFQVVSTVIVRDDPALRVKVVSAEAAMMVPQKPGQTAHHPRKPTRSIDHMSEDNELSCVVGSIYDAAVDPALWTDALAKIAEFVGGQAGALGSKDMVSKFINVDYHVGLDLQHMQMHSEMHGECDPLATVPLFDVGQVVSLRELRPYDDYCKGRFYQERARPQGWGDTAGAVLERSGKSCKFLSVVRSEANDMVDNENHVVDNEMRRRMALLAPHARRAVLIGKAIDRKANEAATFADVLDGLSAGLFLIDAKGLLVHANAAGRGILGADDFLHSIGGRLVARDTRINRTLQEIFADLGDLEIGSKGIALLLTAQEGECHVAHVLPLAAGARRAGAPRTVAAAVFVCRATLETLSSPDVIRRAYQLTPTELRVLFAIVNIGGIPEVATALGVADTTIRTHVGRLFDKTGVGRQADLVKVVAGFSTPLVA
jgi:DNA-binding CsgD family transcriptional regulator